MAKDEVTAKMREAAYNALGSDEMDDGWILGCVWRHEDESAESMESDLAGLEAEFEARGGRGVELADRIDTLRAALAVRKVTNPS